MSVIFVLNENVDLYQIIVGGPIPEFEIQAGYCFES